MAAGLAQAKRRAANESHSMSAAPFLLHRQIVVVQFDNGPHGGFHQLGIGNEGITIAFGICSWLSSGWSRSSCSSRPKVAALAFSSIAIPPLDLASRHRLTSDIEVNLMFVASLMAVMAFMLALRARDRGD
jgi:hypothetical protein